jgi:hypothetical protein
MLARCLHEDCSIGPIFGFFLKNLFSYIDWFEEGMKCRIHSLAPGNEFWINSSSEVMLSIYFVFGLDLEYVQGQSFHVNHVNQVNTLENEN